MSSTRTMSIFAIFYSAQSLSIECVGVPARVKMGEYSNQDTFVIVHIEGKDYRLGDPSDDKTKARLSLVQTALVTDKNTMLRFYNIDSCEVASASHAVPNSVQLLK